MIRSAHDFDWLKAMRQLDPKTKEIHGEDGVYYKSKITNPLLLEDLKISGTVDFIYLVPDKRTIVFPAPDPRTPQKSKLKLKFGSPARFSWEKDWKHVEKALIAYASQNRVGHSETQKPTGEEPFGEWASVTDKSTTMVGGLDWNEGIALRAYLAYKQLSDADRAKKEITSILKQTRSGLQLDLPADVPESLRQSMATEIKIMKGLIDSARIETAESTVCIHSRVKLTITEAVKGLMCASTVQMAPEKDKSVQMGERPACAGRSPIFFHFANSIHIGELHASWPSAWRTRR